MVTATKHHVSKDILEDKTETVAICTKLETNHHNVTDVTRKQTQLINVNCVTKAIPANALLEAHIMYPNE